MFEPTPVYAASGVVYAIAFVVFLSWSRRLSPAFGGCVTC